MNKAFERYLNKLAESKKVSDYLAMRKKRYRSKSCSPWPSSGNENVDELIERSFTVSLEGTTLKINFVTTFEVKEYGLCVLDPIRYEGSEGELVEKIVLKTGGERLFEVKNEVQDIELYQGRFYVYVVNSKGKTVLKSSQEVINPYKVDDIAISSAEPYFFCEQPMEVSVTLSASSLYSKPDIKKVEFVHID